MEERIVSDLIEAAHQAMRNSFGVPTGKRRHGAAVLTTKGGIYASGVYKSETSSLTLHAEQAALAHAAAHGDSEVIAIAIVAEDPELGDSLINPCGLCKQLLYENSLRSGRQIQIIRTNRVGGFDIKDLSEFIVFPWPLNTTTNDAL